MHLIVTNAFQQHFSLHFLWCGLCWVNNLDVHANFFVLRYIFLPKQSPFIISFYSLPSCSSFSSCHVLLDQVFFFLFLLLFLLIFTFSFLAVFYLILFFSLDVFLLWLFSLFFILLYLKFLFSCLCFIFVFFHWSEPVLSVVHVFLCSIWFCCCIFQMYKLSYAIT